MTLETGFRGLQQLVHPEGGGKRVQRDRAPFGRGTTSGNWQALRARTSNRSASDEQNTDKSTLTLPGGVGPLFDDCLPSPDANDNTRAKTLSNGPIMTFRTIQQSISAEGRLPYGNTKCQFRRSRPSPLTPAHSRCDYPKLHKKRAIAMK